MSNYFTDDQVEMLKLNPYVKKVTNKVITYTDRFREEFVAKYLQGVSRSAILKEMGFDPHILGKCRVSGIARYVRIYQDRDGDYSDMRKNNCRAYVKDLPETEQIVRLKQKIEFLEQEIAFLKKNRLLDQKAANMSIKRNQKKNSSLSMK